MVRLINGLTGSETWVHESRLEEYLKRGHKLPPEEEPAEAEPPKPAKKPRKAKAKAED